MRSDTGIDLQRIQPGRDVYGSDGSEIGDVAEVGSNYIVVEKGFLFPKDIYIPASAITSVSEDRIELNVPKDAIEDQGWDAAPAESAAGTDDAAMGDRDYAADASAMEREEGTLERREERLRVDKQPVQTGEVRIGKEVVEEEQSVDVPVTREQVDVSTRPIDRPASGDAFQEERIAVPVTEERVQVDKEARAVEELDVEKVAEEDTERVSETVRREEFRIEDEGDATRR
jgi:uncharacterized protein (TIGR02271 family)